MNRTVTVQDMIDALGMAGQLVSVNGVPSCAALMALYTDPDLAAAGSERISGITYNSLEAAKGSLFLYDCRVRCFTWNNLEMISDCFT